jgi:hypothetical protein
MEVFRFNILPLAEVERREAFKMALNQCPICTEQMQFQYDNDFMQNLIKEECFCPKCQLKIRENFFELQ